MALDGAGYSASQFKMAIKAETTIGTAIVSSMNLLNIDAITFPTITPTQVLDVRSGDGRTAKVADAYISEKHTIKEISFSGYADQTTLPILLQAITTTAQGSSPDSYDVAFNYTPPELQIGASASTNTKTFTVAFISPEAGDDHSIVFKGCVLSSLSISADMGTESGRVTMSGTFQTASTPSYGQGAPSSPTVFSANNYFLTDMHTTRKVAGISNCVIASLTLNIENPRNFLGFNGSTAEPESIISAVPEININLDASIKYDDNTAGLASTFKAGTSVATELSNHGTWTSASTFGIKIDYGKITALTMSENSAMFHDVSIKAMAHTSGDVIQIVA
tara:strand:- start:140 stop:1144 length:1005 start_codon:yes stop_codon:yes gene_type:complete